MLFTKRELIKLHMHFHHLASGTIFNCSSVQGRTKLRSLLESYFTKFHDHVKPIELSVLRLNDFASAYRHMT